MNQLKQYSANTLVKFTESVATAFEKKRLAVYVIALCACFTGGNAHAEFLMQSLEGERVDLHDYVGKGQWTLVMLWTTDCIPCEEQKPMIEEFHNTYKDSSARVIGLALDGPAHQAEIDQLIERHQPSYTNLVAFDDVFSRQFKEETGKPYSVTPTYVFYKPDGTLLAVHAGKVSREALDSVVN